MERKKEKQKSAMKFEGRIVAYCFIILGFSLLNMNTGRWTVADVNRDGRVNIVDVAIVARNLGYDLAANRAWKMGDVNLDGKINQEDLELVVEVFGWIGYE